MLSLGLAPPDPPKKRASAAPGKAKKKPKIVLAKYSRKGTGVGQKTRDTDEFKLGDSDGDDDGDDDEADESGDEYRGKAPRTPKRRDAPSAAAIDTSGLRRSARSTRGGRDLSSAASSPVRRGKASASDDHDDASDVDGDKIKMRNNPRLGERIHDPSVPSATTQ